MRDAIERARNERTLFTFIPRVQFNFGGITGEIGEYVLII